MKTAKNRVSGSLFGMAFGDALAVEPPGDPMRVTDDTQMVLTVGEALLGMGTPYTADRLEEPLCRRAAVSSGDSDSIACLTGAFAGASQGQAIWPEEWAKRIEYRERLVTLGEAWD